MSRKSFSGYTLIEALIYLAIFAIISGSMVGILVTVTQIGSRESASAEVTSQLGFVMQRAEQLIRSSSNIEIDAGVATSTLRLRTKNEVKDPTLLYLDNGVIYLKEGSGSPGALTNTRVAVNNLAFKKFIFYPGHDTVSIDLTMTYNTQDPKSQVQRTLSSAIGRVSAATFDADVLPGGPPYNFSVGQSGSPWQNVIVAPGSAGSPSYTAVERQCRWRPYPRAPSA